jgi:large subunit ribosomal protein L4
MKVKNYKAGKMGEVELDSAPFGDKVLYRTLKDAVVMFQANQRQGTVKTKGRSEVAGSRKKPWKQKHTGRARAGDRKSPIWRGGGVVFGPHPRDFSYHMPAKARRVALRSALFGKIKDSELVLADIGKFDAPSAKAARKILADLGAPRRALLVLHAADENVWKSFRNFPKVAVRTAAELCAHDVINGGLVIAEKAAMTALAERVGIKAAAETGGAS